MPPTAPHPVNPLTLIVATTPIPIRTSPTPGEKIPSRLGIGLNGTLPWPRIKADMSFFARVTSRPPRAGTTNAIVMGRKTYDSLPPSLRPLAKRINVVITRDSSGGVREGIMKELEAKRAKQAAAAAAAEREAEQEQPVTDAIVSSGLDSALETLESGYGVQGRLGNVFVIGGAEIYAAALRMEGSRPMRIVMTNVEKKGDEGFECDTFFPLEQDELSSGKGWRMVSPEEVTEWVGEKVSSDWRDEGEVRIQMLGYERVL